MINSLDQSLEMMRIEVAERLGWRSIEYSKDGYLIGYAQGRKVFSVVPSYVRDIKAAWSLVDYLAMNGVRTKIQTDVLGHQGRSCVAELEFHGNIISKAKTSTAPGAICKAFLSIPAERLAFSLSEVRP